MALAWEPRHCLALRVGRPSSLKIRPTVALCCHCIASVGKICEKNEKKQKMLDANRYMMSIG